MKMEIYFNTKNTGKFREISNIFKYYAQDFELYQISIDVMEPQEESLENVAKIKLSQILNLKDPKLHDKIVFIEDSGLFINALNGFPGVFSSYVHKTIRNEGILKLMENKKDRSAYFKCISVAFIPKFNKVFLFDGIVNGQIAFEIRGSNGFGYDPIFIPNEVSDKTFAELSIDQKNQISHRGKSIKKFIEFLISNN